jgi:hypothetical protein
MRNAKMTMRRAAAISFALLFGALALIPMEAGAYDHWRGGYWGPHFGGAWHHGWFGRPEIVVGFGGGYWPGAPYYGYGALPPPLYVEPPVTVLEVPQAAQPAPAPAPSYYYCDNPAGYYPTVQVCNQPFRAVAATPQR